MKIPTFAKDTQRFIDKNSPAILTGMAVIGTGLTAWFSHKAALQSNTVINSLALDEEIDIQKMKTEDKIKATWKLYLPPAACVVGTSACMIMATKIGLNRTAAMAGAFAVSNKAYDEYKDKVKETLGETKHTKIVDAVAADTVAAMPSDRLVLPHEGEQTFVDAWSGRSFSSTMEKLNKALNDFNKEMLYGSYASLSEFYKRIGLSDIQESDRIGWSKENLLELAYTTVLKDDRAVVLFTFDSAPFATFQDDYV